MTFFSLLLKELRVRMRRERTTWIVICYVLIMGLLGWFFISRSTVSLGYSSNGLSDTGMVLYTLLAQAQLFLIIFITPTLTATTINGEKEHLTYDMLLCSRLSSFSLVAAKLLAALLNTLLLIAASIPLFSQVFFFGGISLPQFFQGMLIFVVTALLIGSFGLFCSALFQRPGISTAVTYMASILWIFLPLISLSIISATSDNSSPVQVPPTQTSWFQISGLLMSSANQAVTPQIRALLVWNPVIALLNTYGAGMALPQVHTLRMHLTSWQAYTYLCLLTSIVFFLLSMWLAKPNALGRLPFPRRKPIPQTSTLGS